MKRSATKYISEEIAGLLESDDELPDSYNEVPDIPAYQNDNRFERLEPIKFEWLHQKLDVNTQDTPSKKQSHPKEPYTIIKKLLSEGTANKQKTLISKGILTKRDIFFIKSIEEYSTDTTLLWFIDFLNNKAVDKPIQRSCLVADILLDLHHGTKEQFSDFEMTYYYKVVVN